MKKLKLRTKIHFVSSVFIAVAITIGVIGIVGNRKTNAALATVYKDRVVPLKQLQSIADDYALCIIGAANTANAGLSSAEETLKSLNEATLRIRENWQAYTASTLTPEEAALATQAEQCYTAADAAIEPFRIFLTDKTGLLKGQVGEFDGPLYPLIHPITLIITELVDLQLRVAKEEYTAAQDRLAASLLLAIMTLIAGGILGGGLGWLVARSTSRAIQNITETLAHGANQTTTSAQEVRDGSHSLAEGTRKQAVALAKTSASLYEIASITMRNAEQAANAATLGRQSRESVNAGQARIAELSTTLHSIKNAVEDMQCAVIEMQTSSKQVSKIIKTIEELSFQTNLLALNASVEAARAGESGLSFAVVAGEFRTLAKRSAKAAQDTAEKIAAAVKRSERGGLASTKVVNSLTEVETTAQSIQHDFDGIVTQIKSLDEVIAEIAASSKEQSQGVNEVNLAVGQMDKGTQSTAQAAEENASAAQEMMSQASEQLKCVAQLEHIVSATAAAPEASEHKEPLPVSCPSRWVRFMALLTTPLPSITK